MTDPTPETEGTWITDPGDPRLAVLWPGAADYESTDLPFPLTVAAIQCADFAPTLDEGEPVPVNWVAAQIMQTRALVRAGIVGDRDQAGLVEETVTVFPMDWTVKNLLRPKKGKPYFGGRRTS